MKSYAIVDRIEGKFAVCELEMLEVEQSRPEDFAQKETVMVDILSEFICSIVGELYEGDVLVVEHDDENVTSIYYKDNAEKARRIELIKQL